MKIFSANSIRRSLGYSDLLWLEALDNPGLREEELTRLRRARQKLSWGMWAIIAFMGIGLIVSMISPDESDSGVVFLMALAAIGMNQFLALDLTIKTLQSLGRLRARHKGEPQ